MTEQTELAAGYDDQGNGVDHEHVYDDVDAEPCECPVYGCYFGRDTAADAFTPTHADAVSGTVVANGVLVHGARLTRDGRCYSPEGVEWNERTAGTFAPYALATVRPHAEALAL